MKVIGILVLTLLILIGLVKFIKLWNQGTFRIKRQRIKQEDLQDKTIQSNGYITKIHKVFYTIWFAFIILLSVCNYYLPYNANGKDTMLILVLGALYPLIPFFITYCARNLFKKSKVLFSIFLLLVLCFYGFFILGSFFNNSYIYIISGWLFLQILSLI